MVPGNPIYAIVENGHLWGIDNASWVRMMRVEKVAAFICKHIPCMTYDEFDTLIENQEEDPDDDAEKEEAEEPADDDAPDDEDSELE